MDSDTSENMEILQPKALVIGSLTAAEIAAIDNYSEIGLLVYSSDQNKLNFVKNGAAHEHITSVQEV